MFTKIKFKEDIPNKWILAIPEDTDLKKFKKIINNGGYVGVYLNNGFLCCLDQKTKEKYINVLKRFDKNNKDSNYYNDVLYDEFQKISGKNKYSFWNNHFPDIKSDLNVVMVYFGGVDGYYPAYFGLSEKGEIVDLTIDFLLDMEEE